ncbi:hypothetical protein CYG49_04020, partial [Candidatus Saccharibacteria bacterium]
MITFLFGSNRFALQSEVQRLQESFEEQFGPAGVEKFDGDDLAPARLGELLQGVSLFSSERMVILRSPGQQRALWDSLGEWMERVPDEVHLVIVQPSPDKRTRTFKLLQQHAVLFEARELDEPSARKWVIAYGAQRKRTITPKDAAHLIARVGLD